MDNQRLTKKLTCLGGGTGTANLMRGLQVYAKNLTVVLSMADEGGSGGRLRRLYNIPMGDMVACLTALAPQSELPLKELLTYRFPGDRYGKDHELGGHKLGNLILVALTHITGDFQEATEIFKKLFGINGTFLPATKDNVTISARTTEGKIIVGEEVIDLGQYHGTRVLDHVFLHPQDAHAGDGVVDAIMSSDAVICGPGDLYTTLLPVLIVPEISHAMRHTRARRIFVVNVANKPFETKGYKVSDFVQAVTKHLGEFPFDTIIVNNNFTIPIPSTYKYTYVSCDTDSIPSPVKIISEDLVDRNFPLYHDSDTLAKVIIREV